MEDIPTHYCLMGYTDVQMLKVALGFEANTKNCKKNLLKSFWWSNWHFGNDVTPTETLEDNYSNVNPPRDQKEPPT